jgi:PKD repeat protein
MKLKLSIFATLIVAFLGFTSQAFAGCKAAFTYSISGSTITLKGDTTNGTSAKYEWSFGDAGTATGHISLTHTYAADGVYEICLSVNDGTCHNKECHTVTIGHPKYCITGNLYRGHDAAYPGHVVRYKFNTKDSTWTPVDTVEIHYSSSTGATYEFSSVEPGVYIVKALLSSTATGYKDYAPTYYKDATTWQHATKIEVHNACVHSADIHFHAVTKKTGKGTVSGHEHHGHKKTADEAIEIMLFDMNDSLVDFTATDANGFYTFANLDNGQYKVYAEVIGLPTYPTLVNITPTNSDVANADITISPTAVFAGINNTTDLNTGASMAIYPNPVKNILNLSVSSINASNVSVTVADINGKVLKTTQSTLNAGTNTINMEMGDLPSGMYFISLQSKNGMVLTHSRFVKE